AVRIRAFSSVRYLLPSCDPVRIYFLANTRLPYLLTIANCIHVKWTPWMGESTAQCIRPSRRIISTAGLLVAGKREASQEAEAQQWMETVIGRRFPPAEVHIAPKLSQKRPAIANADVSITLPKSLGGQELEIFNEPPPTTVILVVPRTRWRWPNDETTPTRVHDPRVLLTRPRHWNPGALAFVCRRGRRSDAAWISWKSGGVQHAARPARPTRGKIKTCITSELKYCTLRLSLLSPPWLKIIQLSIWN
ncbi:hypothetical protein ALC62_03696, partial [Cyphomyrmex costatus]